MHPKKSIFVGKFTASTQNSGMETKTRIYRPIVVVLQMLKTLEIGEKCVLKTF